VAANVELKARDADPRGTLERALALGAEDRGVLVQRDTYFRVARGRLKLREEWPEGAGAAPRRELIPYDRVDAAEARESRFERVPADSALGPALSAALGVRVVVAKRRRLLVRDGVRIHLDEVEGLGAFVELEARVATTTEEAAARCAAVREALAVGAIEPRGYADLLLAGPEDLLAAAREAMARAYVPYSGFPVGAAVRGASGAIHAGANVENASYPQGQCAEANALGALVAAGERAVTAVAVVARDREVCPPCGGCRQRLAELAGPDVPVHLGPATLTLGELLPHAFAL
jgi:homotetrameric cytidine deaminase